MMFKRGDSVTWKTSFGSRFGCFVAVDSYKKNLSNVLASNGVVIVETTSLTEFENKESRDVIARDHRSIYSTPEVVEGVDG